MKRRSSWSALTLGLLGAGACAPAEAPEEAPSEAVEGMAAGSAARHIYVWARDEDGTDSDFLAVFDADPTSPDYGRLVSTAAVGAVVQAHHSEHVMPEGDRLFVNGFRSGQSFVINLADPAAPFVEASFTNAGPYTYPHSFERTPDGNVLATFQNRGDSDSGAGGLVELDPLGNYVRGTAAADPVDPELRPYSLAPIPGLDRIVTTTGDMWMKLEGRSFQIWRMTDLSLVQTVLLPPGPRGDENLDVAEARVLDDGKTVIVTTFRCGMYTVTGVDTDEPVVELVWTFPFESYDVGDECGLPALRGRFWVQTVQKSNSLVVLDLSDPHRPRQVSELVLGEGILPHWISGEVGGDRIVLTGDGDWLAGRAVLLHLDPETGGLSVIEDFRTPGAAVPGADMSRASWPHGDTGPAVPHGAVFSRD